MSVKHMLTRGGEKGTVGEGAMRVGYMSRAQKREEANKAFLEGVREEVDYYRRVIEDNFMKLGIDGAKAMLSKIIQSRMGRDPLARSIAKAAVEELKRRTGISVEILPPVKSFR